MFLLTVHLDIVCNENQLDALFIFSYFVNQPLYASGIFFSHHQELFTVYVQQLVLGSWSGQDGTVVSS
jgi:hypothetical protein